MPATLATENARDVARMLTEALFSTGPASPFTLLVKKFKQLTTCGIIHMHNSVPNYRQC